MEMWLVGMQIPSLVFCLWSFWRWRCREKNRQAKKAYELEIFLEEQIQKLRAEEEAFLKRPF